METTKTEARGFTPSPYVVYKDYETATLRRLLHDSSRLTLPERQAITKILFHRLQGEGNGFAVVRRGGTL